MLRPEYHRNDLQLIWSIFQKKKTVVIKRGVCFLAYTNDNSIQ